MTSRDFLIPFLSFEVDHCRHLIGQMDGERLLLPIRAISRLRRSLRTNRSEGVRRKTNEQGRGLVDLAAVAALWSTWSGKGPPFKADVATIGNCASGLPSP